MSTLSLPDRTVPEGMPNLLLMCTGRRAGSTENHSESCTLPESVTGFSARRCGDAASRASVLRICNFSLAVSFQCFNEPVLFRRTADRSFPITTRGPVLRAARHESSCWFGILMLTFLRDS